MTCIKSILGQQLPVLHTAAGPNPPPIIPAIPLLVLPQGHDHVLVQEVHLHYQVSFLLSRTIHHLQTLHNYLKQIPLMKEL